nr:immunoglobulin heavy chain junction region [Macaca mulatta]MOX00170.1 immunoglobulin heavy chain junction region [Macaca mulatta]MOX00308.1 immunoglobulin heavy chain junction region [Macaca mulatta]MOX00446.1 immunoglobulin heavy chain junction region [Macaca mulatta]MOX01494.1 immunoglobulin heavy chain junction region [Macaca mulatta]
CARAPSVWDPPDHW